MTKIEFKKYRARVTKFNIFYIIFLFVFFAGLLLLALYNKSVNDFLFSNIYLERYLPGDNFLFGLIWIILIMPLLAINITYFEVKGEYYLSEKITEKTKDNKKLKKFVFYFFLFTTIVNLIFVIFLVEEIFVNTYGYNFSDNTFIYSFLALLPNITLVIAAKIL